MAGELLFSFRNPVAAGTIRYDPRRHPNQMRPDPSGPVGSFYLANGIGGVARITLP